jgi:hypothetical protein
MLEQYPHPNVIISNTKEARDSYEKYLEHILAASERYLVVVGPQGVVFYDPREFNADLVV